MVIDDVKTAHFWAVRRIDANRARIIAIPHILDGDRALPDALGLWRRNLVPASRLPYRGETRSMTPSTHRKPVT